MGLDHILYICISLPVAIGLAILGKFIINKKWQKLYIFMFALITVALHYSVIYVSYFHNDSGTIVGRDHLFPYYFCNFIMNIELILAMELHFKARFMNNALTFCAYGGILGSLITLFEQGPHFDNYYLLQSALSHSTMLTTSLLLILCGYVKINVYNLIPMGFGILVSGAMGGLTMLIYVINGEPVCNAMYLLEGPAGFEKITGPVFAL